MAKGSDQIITTNNLLTDWLNIFRGGNPILDFKIQLENLRTNWFKIQNKPEVFPNDVDLRTARIRLTSDNIINLNTTPITLLNPVADHAISIIDIAVVYKYGSQPYTNGGDLELYSDQFGHHVYGKVISNIYTSTSNPYAMKADVLGMLYLSHANPLKVKTLTANPQNGDGEMEINIIYRLIRL
jgi:hypothetical protein